MPRLAALLALLAPLAPATAAAPALSGLVPVGGTRGTTLAVTFVGARLGDPLEVVTPEPGVSVTELVAESPGRVRATFAIAPDCPLGEHGFCLRTKSGVSDTRTFWVGALPATPEAEPNGEFDKAQPVGLNTTITGVIKREDVDYFAVECKKGQRLAVEVEGMRLGQQWWDPAVAILDARRFQVAASDDAPGLGQDAGCSVVVPADGKYTIQLRDSAYQGGDACHYRLHVGHFPRPAVAVPCGGRPGETLEVRLLGDAAGEIKQRVTLPATPGEFVFHARTPDGVHPAGVRLRVSDLPAARATDAAAKPEAAVVAAVPGALEGVVAKPGEGRWFRFAAKKGQAFEVKCFARRLGSPLDAVVSLFRAGKGTYGEHLVTNDDAPGTPDAALRFDAPADGEYYLRVGDHLYQGGPDYAFRVELAPPRAETVATLPKVDGNNVANQERQAVAVPRGGRTAVLVSTTRANWGGAIRLGFGPLPQGVAADAPEVSAAVAQVPVVFSAAATAPCAGSRAEVAATPTDPNAKVPSRTELDFKYNVGQPNNTPYHSYTTDRVCVAVTDPAPFSVEVVEPKVPLPQNASMNLKVVATRAKGFAAPIVLYPVWTPPGVGIQGGVTIPAGATEALVSVNAAGNAPVAAWKTALFAFGDAGAGQVTTSTQLFALAVSPPVVALAQNRAAVEQGGVAQVACKVEFPEPLSGQAVAKLLGLPAKATAADRPLAPDAKEVVFEVVTAKDTPTGKHNLFCQVVVTRNGETVAQSAGGGELRVDVPLPPKAQTAGKPEPNKPAPQKSAEPRLSRLEQLRRKK